MMSTERVETANIVLELLTVDEMKYLIELKKKNEEDGFELSDREEFKLKSYTDETTALVIPTAVYVNDENGNQTDVYAVIVGKELVTYYSIMLAMNEMRDMITIIYDDDTEKKIYITNSYLKNLETKFDLNPEIVIDITKGVFNVVDNMKVSV